jgi:hypothetical protein
MKCPGQDMKYWKDNAIFEVPCPKCGTNVEFYKDDTTRKCSNCNHRFVNPKMDFGCASYCPFAEQCIGTLPEEFSGAKEALFKDKVAVGMKRFYGSDFKRIRQATVTAQHAENIAKSEKASLALVLCAAYLNEISHDDAQHILLTAGAGDDLVQKVMAIHAALSLHNDNDSLAAKIVNDALTIRNWQERQKDREKESTVNEEDMASKLLTESAKSLFLTLANA